VDDDNRAEEQASATKDAKALAGPYNSQELSKYTATHSSA
jgi:hypothetical protein